VRGVAVRGVVVSKGNGERRGKERDKK